jgi:thioredoxin-dependent peroxiredoxin
MCRTFSIVADLPLILAFSCALPFAIACNKGGQPCADRGQGCVPPPAAPMALTSAAASVAASSSASAAPVAASDVVVGQPPPDFTATAQDGTPVHLAALKGKPVVIYFYPKDETAGCTKEACSFRDSWDALQAKGVVLIGISQDTDDSHRAFATNHKLPFLLVSDPKGDLAAKFGVPVKMGYDARQSFVIGADGNVKKIYRDVNVTVHAKEIEGDLS